MDIATKTPELHWAVDVTFRIIAQIPFIILLFPDTIGEIEAGAARLLHRLTTVPLYLQIPICVVLAPVIILALLLHWFYEFQYKLASYFIKSPKADLSFCQITKGGCKRGGSAQSGSL